MDDSFLQHGGFGHAWSQTVVCGGAFPDGASRLGTLATFDDGFGRVGKAGARLVAARRWAVVERGWQYGWFDRSQCPQVGPPFSGFGRRWFARSKWPGT